MYNNKSHIFKIEQLLFIMVNHNSVITVPSKGTLVEKVCFKLRQGWGCYRECVSLPDFHIYIGLCILVLLCFFSYRRDVHIPVNSTEFPFLPYTLTNWSK